MGWGVSSVALSGLVPVDGFCGRVLRFILRTEVICSHQLFSRGDYEWCMNYTNHKSVGESEEEMVVLTSGLSSLIFSMADWRSPLCIASRISTLSTIASHEV
jgi:hypothetical protein